MKYLKLFTSESVTEGHPDKIADQISDAILDAILAEDKDARVACETFVTTGLVVVGGEITTTAQINYQDVVRNKIKEIGYTNADFGLDYKSCAVMITLDKQSPDISQGVDYEDGVIGAGDQGIMFGYATNETENYMPIAIDYAHKLAAKLAEIRKEKVLGYLRPDAKTQVTVEYDENDLVKRIDAIVISTQHNPDVTLDEIKADLRTHVIDAVIPAELIDEGTRFYINPTGTFIIGGPQGDAGLTGRKIIIDTYGGAAKHGGGAFSGKDYTKVDRAAAYVARYLAKNIVAAGVSRKAEIQLSYAIGVAEPISISLDTFGEATDKHDAIINAIYDNFDLSPNGIIELLDLKRPIYSETTVYGHFGKENLPWEQLDKVEIFKPIAEMETVQTSESEESTKKKWFFQK